MMARVCRPLDIEVDLMKGGKMNKHIVQNLGLLILVFLISGCHARAYTQVRDKVDQDMSGNVGYIQGTAPASETDRSSIRKTRNTYVLEIETKKPIEKEETPKTITQKRTGVVEIVGESESSQDVLKAGLSEEQKAVMAGPVEYTVKENDTLQKISKQFYNTYRKWDKIYEANKEKIKNPNRITPGMVLTIPQE